jgi:hypothetical protein
VFCGHYRLDFRDHEQEIRKEKKPWDKKTEPPHITKGRLVEEIVEKMHDNPNVRVQRRIFLDPVGGGSSKREIDVLLTGDVGGYPVRLAIECKNEKKPISLEKVDAFVGKLQDVGIPTHLGIYVSVNGYTGGAVQRAKKAGIKTLVLRGLTKDRLSAAVTRAFQSMVYLFAEIVRFKIQNELSSVEEFAELSIFYDADGVPQTTFPDMIWHAWVDGSSPSDLGEHELNFEVPEGWRNIADGKTSPLGPLSAVIRVAGFVVTFSGEARRYSLFDAENKQVERSRTSVSFDGSTAPGYPVRGFETEEELREYLEDPEVPRVLVGRLRMPRIRMSATFWPPSERTMAKVVELMQAYEAGAIPDPRPFKFDEVEGTDLGTMFEPIWPGHPAAGGKW